MLRTIAVGRDFDPGSGTVDLICLPGEALPAHRPGLCACAPATLADALLAIRIRFAEHKEIATLAGATVLGTHEWTPHIETRLFELLEDLGNCVMDSWEGVRNTLRNGARIASGSTSRELAGALKGSPAICIGAGPSATPEVMRRISRLCGSHYVFSCDAMTHACGAAGFAPDFVTLLERVPQMLPLVEGADPRSTLIAMPVVDPACVSQFSRVCWFWGGDDLYKWLDPSIEQTSAGRSSGTLAIAAAILAGCSPIYLVGHDLAYGPDLAGHSTAAHREAADGQAKKDENATGGFYELTYPTVPGYSGPVKTNGAWNLMRGDIESMVAVSPETVFVSAQDGAGARIEGVPSGSLPADGFGPAFTPSLPSGTVRDPRERLASIREDCHRLGIASSAILEAIASESADLNAIATANTVTALVSHDNRALFWYALRTVYNNLSLRMHLWSGVRPDMRQLQRDCLAILAVSLRSLVRQLEEDFPCPPTP